MITKSGESAFPQPNQCHPGNSDPEKGAGMTLRDYFAAKAMQGLCANVGTNRWGCEECAKNAYKQADAMLKAREL